MKEIGIMTHSFVDAYNGRTGKLFGGGLERYLYDLCGVVKELGLKPVIYQLSYIGGFEEEIDGIRVLGRSAQPGGFAEGFNRMSREIVGPLLYSSGIWQPIRYRPGSMGICHGINWDYYRGPRSMKNAVADHVQNALNGLDRIVSVDSHFLTFCRSVCTMKGPEQVVLLPNAVDLQRFAPRQGPSPEKKGIRILYPRRMSPERGMVPMMLAVDPLLEQYPELTVEFAGEFVEGSPFTFAFRMWHREHPCKDRIVQRTYTFDGIPEAYGNADIVVIPTVFSEGTSLSCLEAMGCGRAVIATNVGGLNDLIIDGYNGLLTAPTPEKLTAAMRTLIEDRELRQLLGIRARLTAAAFDKSVWKQKWSVLLEEYLEAPC